jgi:hypothetical protein
MMPCPMASTATGSAITNAATNLDKIVDVIEVLKMRIGRGWGPEAITARW